MLGFFVHLTCRYLANMFFGDAETKLKCLAILFTFYFTLHQIFYQCRKYIDTSVDGWYIIEGKNRLDHIERMIFEKIVVGIRNQMIAAGWITGLRPFKHFFRYIYTGYIESIFA